MTSDTWLTPKKAAQELKRRNPSSMIGEKLIRGICDNGHIQRRFNRVFTARNQTD